MEPLKASTQRVEPTVTDVSPSLIEPTENPLFSFSPPLNHPVPSVPTPLIIPPHAPILWSSPALPRTRSLCSRITNNRDVTCTRNIYQTNCTNLRALTFKQLAYQALAAFDPVSQQLWKYTKLRKRKKSQL